MHPDKAKKVARKFLKDEGWAMMLYHEFTKNYIKKVGRKVNKDRQVVDVYPPKNKVFRAFQETPYEKVRVVIVGQD